MIIELKSFNHKSLCALILTIASLSVIPLAQQVLASSDDRQASSSDDAVSAGWKEGKNDYLNGNSFEYSCPSSRPDTYCGLYRWGYEQGWNSQINLGRGYGSEPQ